MQTRRRSATLLTKPRSTSRVIARRPWHRTLCLTATALAALIMLPALAHAQENEDLRIVRQALFGGLRNQVGTLPIPTGGAFTYDFDPALGVFTRTTDTLGPIFADRADTIGRGRLAISTSFTYHSYDELDGVSLDSGRLQSVTQVSAPGRLTRVSLYSITEDVKAEVYTFSATYGVTNSLDVGITIPIVRVKLTETNTRLGFRDCPPSFRGGAAACTTFFAQFLPTLPNSEESSGLGDIDLRAKYHFLTIGNLMGGRLGLAASLNVKAPTGDGGDQTTFERARLIRPKSDLVVESRFETGRPPRGTGTFRVKPQLIASGSWFGFEPHANVGAELGETEGVTNDIIYAVGAAYAATPAVTFVFDVVGRYSLDVKRRRAEGFLGPAGLDQRINDLAAGRSTQTGKADPHTVTASIGLKVNPVGTLIMFLNFLVPLNDANLRDDVTPTAGLEWTF